MLLHTTPEAAKKKYRTFFADMWRDAVRRDGSRWLVLMNEEIDPFERANVFNTCFDEAWDQAGDNGGLEWRGVIEPAEMRKMLEHAWTDTFMRVQSLVPFVVNEPDDGQSSDETNLDTYSATLHPPP